MANQTPQDLPREPDAAFAEWLEARHEWIVRGDADTDVAKPKTESATELPKEYENADRTLRALAQLRTLRRSGMWRPDGAASSRAASDASSPDANGVSRLGRFVLREEVGRGGFGLVYRAFDPELKREVALKIPRPETLFSEDRQRRFEDEAHATARLRHPNICRVHEVGEDGAIRFLVVEYCDGPDLAEWLRARTENVPLQLAARLFIALASGVQHAHIRGVLHRDLKPSNILLETNSPNPEERDTIPFTPRIVDFGLAKLMEQSSDVTKTGDRLGTVDYMAPEQADGRVRDIGVATDVFALGVMLYEVLTGRRPFAGETQGESLKNLLTSDPPRPRKLRHDIPEDLEAICLKCLEKDQAKRYGSADELANDLRRWLNGEPTAARPLTPVQRVENWTRRHPALAALYGVSLLAIVVLVANGWSYNRRLNSLFATERMLREQADDSRDALKTQIDSNRQRVYAIDMRIALEAFQSGHIAAVRERLIPYLPKSGQNDLRTTVWELLWRFCEDQDTVLYRHDGAARHIASCPNGAWFATAGASGKIFAWDAATTRSFEIRAGGAAHSDEINGLDASRDGRLLISSSEDGTVKIWSMPGGSLEKVISIWNAPESGPSAVAISHTGEMLAIGDDQGVRLWTHDDFRDVGQLEHPGAVHKIAFSPDGTLLATACADSRVRVWTIGDRTLLHTFSHHYKKGTGVSDVTFAHNSRLMATAGSGDGAVNWFDAHTGEHLGGIQFGDSAVLSIMFSDDDRGIVLSNASGAIKQIEFSDMRDRQMFFKDLVGVRGIAFSPNQNDIIAACEDGSVRRIAASCLKSSEHTSPELPYALDVRLTANPVGLLTHISDGVVTLRDLRNGEAFFNIDAAGSDEILERLSVSDRAGRFAFVLKSGATEVRSLNGQMIFRTPNLEREVLSTAISTSGEFVADGDRRGELMLWRANSDTPIHSRQTHQGALSLIRFSPDDEVLLVVGKDDVTIRGVRDLKTLHALKGVSNEAYTGVFHPRESLVATNDGKQVVLWNFETGAVSRLQGHADTVVCLDLSPDGSTLASGGRDGQLILWDMRTTERIGPLLENTRVINSVDFSSDGRMLAAGVISSDNHGRFKLWAWGNHNVDEYTPFQVLRSIPGAWPPAGGTRRTQQADAGLIIHSNDFDDGEWTCDGVVATWTGGSLVDCAAFSGTNHVATEARAGDGAPTDPDFQIVSGKMLHAGENDFVTLTLQNLPPHQSVDLDFVLAIIDTWDGIRDGVDAPDIFSVYVDDAPVFREGFSSRVQDAAAQIYLPPIEAVLMPPGKKNCGFGHDADALYDMSRESRFGAIPHTADTLVVKWRAEGAGIQSIDDESWAIENVRVVLRDAEGGQ